MLQRRQPRNLGIVLDIRIEEKLVRRLEYGRVVRRNGVSGDHTFQEKRRGRFDESAVGGDSSIVEFKETEREETH